MFQRRFKKKMFPGIRSHEEKLLISVKFEEMHLVLVSVDITSALEYMNHILLFENQGFYAFILGHRARIKAYLRHRKELVYTVSMIEFLK